MKQITVYLENDVHEEMIRLKDELECKNVSSLISAMIQNYQGFLQGAMPEGKELSTSELLKNLKLEPSKTPEFISRMIYRQ